MAGSVFGFHRAKYTSHADARASLLPLLCSARRLTELYSAGFSYWQCFRFGNSNENDAHVSTIIHTHIWPRKTESLEACKCIYPNNRKKLIMANGKGFRLFGLSLSIINAQNQYNGGANVVSFCRRIFGILDLSSLFGSDEPREGQGAVHVCNLCLEYYYWYNLMWQANLWETPSGIYK